MTGPVVNVPQGRRIRYRSLYWVLPTIAAACWFSLILGLLLWWAVDDNARQYQVEQATIVYVSNIGAAHQWLFIFLGSMTAVFYILSLLAERWLRHLRRIPGALRKRDRNADIVALVFGIGGGIALILLTCFNAVTHSTGHWTCTAIFVVCIAASALAQTLELHWLHQDHVDRKHLRRNCIIKWGVVVLAICAAIAFGASYGVCAGSQDGVPLSAKCNRVKSAAGELLPPSPPPLPLPRPLTPLYCTTMATLEWLIATLYGVYLISLIFDLWPATKTVGHKFDERLIAEDKANTLHFHKRSSLPGAPGGIGQLDHNNATLDAVEMGTARPSESTAGEYGAYAPQQSAASSVAQPEMAHVHGMNGHGPVTREAY